MIEYWRRMRSHKPYSNAYADHEFFLLFNKIGNFLKKTKTWKQKNRRYEATVFLSL